MIAHEFLAPDAAVRCVHCGTKQGHHRLVSQPCVPRWGEAEALRPEPVRRDYAVDAIDFINARIVELETDRREALNRPASDDAINRPAETGEYDG